ncbi:MAG: complex I NDUFA9 subunit family protein, partial [Gammaproteobacteria bacterium]|nr:complex I NDUFA9 subunit family protein [Gammaproteobacteria bacterium]
YGKKLDLCGPDEYTLKQLVEYTCELLNIKRKIIGLPKIISHLQAVLFEYIPGKPFSIDNYNSLKIDSLCKNTSPQPTSLEMIAPSYLGSRNAIDEIDILRKKHQINP